MLPADVAWWWRWRVWSWVSVASAVAGFALHAVGSSFEYRASFGVVAGVALDGQSPYALAFDEPPVVFPAPEGEPWLVAGVALSVAAMVASVVAVLLFRRPRGSAL